MATRSFSALTAAVAAGLLSLGAAPAAADHDKPYALPAAKGPVSATLEACRRAAHQEGRFAIFAAEMRTIPGAARMSMRFDLYRRKPSGGRARRVSAPGLGVWRRSAPEVDIFRYHKQVTNLPAPATFRAVVRYRWYDRSGHVLKRARRATPACRQPDPRPDLVVGQVTVEPAASPDSARYLIVVRNDGRSDAGRFDALLSVDGAMEAAQSIPSLAAGSQRTVSFVGPRCRSGSLVRVVVDPADGVDEADERNDSRTVPCPL